MLWFQKKLQNWQLESDILRPKYKWSLVSDSVIKKCFFEGVGWGVDFPDERSPSWVNIQIDHTQLQKETNWGFIVYRFRVWTVQTVLCSEVEHWLNLQIQGLARFRNQSSSLTKVTNPMVTTTPFNLSPLNKSDWIDNKRCFSFVHQYSVFVFVFWIFQMY